MDGCAAQPTQSMEVDGATAARIRQLKRIVERELPKAVEKLGDQRATPVVRHLFPSEPGPSDAKEAHIERWRLISAAAFDGDCHSDRRCFDQEQPRAGLQLRRRIGGDALIAEHLIKAIVLELWPKGVFRHGAADAAIAVGAALASLVRAVFLDMDRDVAACLEEQETAWVKASAERDRAAREQGSAIDRLAAALAKLAEKDLTSRIVDDMPEPFRRLKVHFNSAVERLADAFKTIGSSADNVRLGARQVASASDHLAERAGKQAAALEEAAAALGQITTAVAKTAKGLGSAKGAAAAVRNDALQGEETIRQVSDAMAEIERSWARMEEIIAVIEENAFQTNLHALNACIEAARAGDLGRGFASVASEVRGLAQQSAEAASEAKDLALASSAKAGGGLASVARISEALQRFETGVREIDEAVSNIATQVLEQAAGLARIDAAATNMDQVAQESAALFDETNAASRLLATESVNLSSLIEQVQFEGPAPDALRREGERALPARRDYERCRESSEYLYGSLRSRGPSRLA